jgi:hypothetical protein
MKTLALDPEHSKKLQIKIYKRDGEERDRKYIGGMPLHCYREHYEKFVIENILQVDSCSGFCNVLPWQGWISFSFFMNPDIILPVCPELTLAAH